MYYWIHIDLNKIFTIFDQSQVVKFMQYLFYYFILSYRNDKIIQIGDIYKIICLRNAG